MERISLWNTGRVETVQGYSSTDTGRLYYPRYGLAGIEFGPKIGRAWYRESLKHENLTYLKWICSKWQCKPKCKKVGYPY